ncbi:hypothetical protein [Undibacterium squillarum]|uniref:NERD domain-containing protein n=1 Tax=Undibacterium squillarum TaxID=1131567 RepID=A0ABQ2XV58_9BURK|nr:hypothetical protein [Undibacterium squillarum]GGX35241.1 hypothetical protein GCM10010946_10760 [Undibacterium squillarum]
MKTLRSSLINGDFKSPIQSNFSKEKWNENFSYSLRTSDCEMLHEAGTAIYDELSQIRKTLSNLYKNNFPNISRKKLLQLYCAISNRERAVVNKEFHSQNLDTNNIFSQTISNNPLENKLTLMEASNASVDAFQKAILSTINNLEIDPSPKPGNEPLEIIEFILIESHLSQIYSCYEQIWKALVWGEYKFSWIDKSKKIAKIIQSKSSSEIAFEASQIRRARFESSVAKIEFPFAKNYPRKYITTTSSGKNREYIIKDFQISSENISSHDFSTRNAFRKALENFPASFMEKEFFDEKIRLREIIDIFCYFVIFSVEIQNKFPENDEIHTSKKLSEFAIVISLVKISKAIEKASKIKLNKVKKIIDFLTYKNSNQDIWCHPIIFLEKEKFCILTSAFQAPNPNRVIEHWLVKLDTNLAEKGYIYEGNIINSINYFLNENEFLSDYDHAISKRIKIKNKLEEEIDLIFRIGSLIIIGEAKCIISTNSPQSFYRAQQILRKAASQINRKKQFFQENIIEIFKNLGWDYNPKFNYKVISLVLNSNGMHAGFPINGTPICDERILTALIRKNTYPIISKFKKNHRIDLAWIKLYSSQEELIEIFQKYLENPPQITEDIESFEYKYTNIQCHMESSLQLIYGHLIPKDIDLSDKLARTYCAPLEVDSSFNKNIPKNPLII